jgi:hypothetical protein
MGRIERALNDVIEWSSKVEYVVKTFMGTSPRHRRGCGIKIYAGGVGMGEARYPDRCLMQFDIML